MTDAEIQNIAGLKAELIGVEFADADEAWDSLNEAVGHEPNFAVADYAFAVATGQEQDWIGPVPTPEEEMK